MGVPIITLKEYRKMINRKSLDIYEDLPVVYSGDDECNYLDRVLCEPGIIEVDEINNDPSANFKEAVCIN